MCSLDIRSRVTINVTLASCRLKMLLKVYSVRYIWQFNTEANVFRGCVHLDSDRHGARAREALIKLITSG